MFERVFCKATELGREEELFGMTRDEKELWDTTQKYHTAVNEYELLGNQADLSPADFFVSL